jgi:sugar lactone lactonase YvrE
VTNPLNGWAVDSAEITLTGTGLLRPECVLAQPAGDLWVADLRGGVVHIAPDGSQEVIRPLDGGGPFAPADDPNIDGNQGFSMPNGLCFDPDGNVVVANFGTNVVEHLTRDGHWSLIADSVVWPDGSLRPIGKANFPALDRDGRLWFSVTASVEAWHKFRGQGLAADGYIAVIDDWEPGKASQARVAAIDLHGANELRFSPDGTELYVAETAGDHMTRFQVGPDATLTDRQVYGPERLGGDPDGFAFDAHGNLWTTLISRDTLVAITPEGDVLTLWEDGDRAARQATHTAVPGASAPTSEGRPGDGLAPRMASVTFGGPDLQTVYVGSLGGTALPTFRSPVPGAPLPHWSADF